MTREEVKKLIPDIADDVLNKLMDMHGKTVTGLQNELNNTKSTLKTAQDTLKSFEGVDVKELQNKVTDLTNQLTEQAEGYAFDNLLDGAIRDYKGKNIKAIRSMLDVDALKESKNREADIKTALDKCKEESSWAFGEAEDGTKTKVKVDGGAPMGGGNSSATPDGVEAAFMELNPGLKI